MKTEAIIYPGENGRGWVGHIWPFSFTSLTAGRTQWYLLARPYPSAEGPFQEGRGRHLLLKEKLVKGRGHSLGLPEGFLIQDGNRGILVENVLSPLEAGPGRTGLPHLWLPPPKDDVWGSDPRNCIPPLLLSGLWPWSVTSSPRP